ncbi:MAG: acetolactate synthase catalytic subunit [Betaproteobacteria bacterium]|nr:MAG: acetolactate synthase catalytic subunit [Betaproteobacteria bacterium]
MANVKTVAQAIAASLARHGVRVMFSQSLPSSVVLAAEDAGIRQLTYRTENAGGAMADGYARIAQRVSVVLAQNGPAATLLVAPLAEALKSSIPVVALVQDVERANADRNAFQELDHLALFQGCTKWVRRLGAASRVEDYVDMAFAAAAGGRPGPAVLLLPADLFDETAVDSGRRRAQLGACPLDRTVADPERLDAAADSIAAARHPVIVAGGGVHLSGAADALSRLQGEAHLPVVTTVMGKGAVAEDHPLSLGVGGNILGRMSPSYHLRPVIERADVVVLIGTRTAQNGTDSWTALPGNARYVHIDVDPIEIGRNYESMRLAGDAKLTLEALAERLRGRRSVSPALIDEIAAGRERGARDIAALLASDACPVRPERIMAEIQKVLTPDTIVVADASYSSVWIASYLRCLEPGMRFLTPRGIAGLGWGLPMAIGAKAARPDRPVLCVTGDGAFGHVWSELETARRSATPVIVTVLNNGVLAYQKDAEDVKYERHTGACQFSPVDHAAIARACGCRGVTVRHPREYLPALREALASGETTLIDVDTDPEAYPPITLFDGKLDAIREKRRQAAVRKAA